MTASKHTEIRTYLMSGAGGQVYSASYFDEDGFFPKIAVYRLRLELDPLGDGEG